jgi:periplasmic protein TonB
MIFYKEPFEDVNVRYERESKMKSISITIVFHAMLLLIFGFMFSMSKPYPPLSDSGGVEVNLGMDLNGMGDVQPEGTSTQLQTPSSDITPSQQSLFHEKIVTQDNEDAPVITKPDPKPVKHTTQPSNTKTQHTTQTNPAAVQPVEKAKSLYPGSKPNSSTSEGNGNKIGDMGQPNGDPNGTSYSGNPGNGLGGAGGFGNGVNLNLSGRKILKYPTISDNSQKTGTVVVQIKVDRSGNVISAVAVQKGSTTTDSYLFNLAQQAALQTQVDPDENAAEEQFGYMTFTFRVK